MENARGSGWELITGGSTVTSRCSPGACYPEHVLKFESLRRHFLYSGTRIRHKFEAHVLYKISLTLRKKLKVSAKERVREIM